MSGTIRPDARPAAGHPPQHVGLVLDRYQPKPRPTDPAAFDAFLQRVTDTPASSIYAAAYSARLRTLTGDSTTATAEFNAAGSGLIVGLGGVSVRETSISLLRNYGVPYIPGSALKGLARAWVRHALKESGVDPSDAKQWSEASAVFFGDQSSAAYVVWHDAWYVPGSAPHDRPLRRDVITVHHPVYYSTRGRARAPWDLDDPNPVPYLTATGHYLVAIDGPTAEWATLALDLLTRALADLGAGAKTSSGYGRLARLEASSENLSSVAASDAVAESPLVRQIRNLAPNHVKGQIGNFATRWRQLEDSAERRAVAQAILDRLDAAYVPPRWRESKEWFLEIREFLEQER